MLDWTEMVRSLSLFLCWYVDKLQYYYWRVKELTSYLLQLLSWLRSRCKHTTPVFNWKWTETAPSARSQLACLVPHQRVTAVFTRSQTNRAKGGNTSCFRTTPPNNSGVKEPSKNKCKFKDLIKATLLGSAKTHLQSPLIAKKNKTGFFQIVVVLEKRLWSRNYNFKCCFHIFIEVPYRNYSRYLSFIEHTIQTTCI